jgi:hypothetical protein
MYKSRNSEPSQPPLERPTKQKTAIDRVLISRIIAQKNQRQSKLVGRKFILNVSVGGLTVVLGVIVVLWMLSSFSESLPKGATSTIASQEDSPATTKHMHT